MPSKRRIADWAKAPDGLEDMRAKLRQATATIKSGNRIAAETGIDQARISRLLAGKGQPLARELALIAAALGLSLDYLMDEGAGLAEPLTPAEVLVIESMRRTGVRAGSVLAAIADLAGDLREPARGPRVVIGLPGAARPRRKKAEREN